jgi:hypothetical protein
MKSSVLIAALLITWLATSPGQEIGTKYSGSAEIPGLGVVDFPAGEWFLEFRHPPPTPNPARRPDYFGFRKVSPIPERLGFRCYDPITAPGQLVHCLDGIGEDLGEGAPSEALGSIPTGGTIYPMRIEPSLSDIKADTKEIAYSFIHINSKRPLNWLCHTFLFSKEGWAFVIFHASPSVTNPDTVRELTWIHRPATSSSTK